MVESQPKRPDDARIIERLRCFKPIRNPLLDKIVNLWGIGLLPLGIGLYVVTGYMTSYLSYYFKVYSINQIVFLTGLLAVGVAAFFLRILLNKIPETLEQLWVGGLVNHGESGSTAEVSSTPGPGRQNDPTAHYLRFIDQFEAKLNDPVGSICCSMLLVAMISAYSIAEILGFNLHYIDPGYVLSRIIGNFAAAWQSPVTYAAEILLAFILGLLLWRMIAVAWGVQQFGKQFENLRVQIQHPDRCGGLSPLGYLCFLNALIAAIPCLQLSFMIWCINSIYKTWRDTYYSGLEPALRDNVSQLFLTSLSLCEGFLLVNIVLAFITFIYPLISIHNAMVRNSYSVQPYLGKISVRIEDLSRETLEDLCRGNTDGGNSADIGQMKAVIEQRGQEIELLNSAHEQYRSFPVWPFNSKIALKFGVTQMIPVLTLLITDENIRNVLLAPLNFILGK